MYRIYIDSEFVSGGAGKEKKIWFQIRSLLHRQDADAGGPVGMGEPQFLPRTIQQSKSNNSKSKKYEHDRSPVNGNQGENHHKEVIAGDPLSSPSPSLSVSPCLDK